MQIDMTFIAELQQTVCRLLDSCLPKEYTFHTRDHTLDVLKNVNAIGESCRLPEEELNIARCSALFHDLGYIQTYSGHEEKSVKFAAAYLRERKVDEKTIVRVAEAILATRVPQRPKDRIAMVLCDADLMHLASKDYFEKMERLRQEWVNIGRTEMTPSNFCKNSLAFFDSHHFHTEYGRKVLQPEKEKIRRLIMERMTAG